MKYDFKKLDEDTYELINLSDNASYQFKRTIDLMKDLDSIEANARLKMIKYMIENKIKKDDLIIRETVADGKVVYDESYYRDFEAGFIQTEQYNTINGLYLKLFKKGLLELTEELKLNADEALMFGTKLRAIINGVDETKTPSV